MANTNLTTAQSEVLNYMWAAYQASMEGALTGLLPSTREITEHFGWSSQTAAMSHLKALEKKGYLRGKPGKARAYMIVKLP